MGFPVAFPIFIIFSLLFYFFRVREGEGLAFVNGFYPSKWFATWRQTIPLWLRYVDDTFTAVLKDEIDAFHDHLNKQNVDIQFTKEIEDCLVSRDNNEPRTTVHVYRKTTHTDRFHCY